MLGVYEKSKVLDAIDSTRKSLEEARLKEETASNRIAEASDDLERFQRSLELVVATSIREGYEKALKRLGSHLAPISILPNEILSYVFSTGLEMELQARQSTLAPVMALREREFEGLAPFGLNFAEKCSHVNSHWRQVALAAPILWRELKFSKKAAKNERERVWLERSKCTPLSIYLPPMHKHLFDDLLETLRPHLHRTQIISNEEQQWKHLAKIFHIMPPRMDNLHTLELRADHATSNQFIGGTLRKILMEGAPRLQEVILEYTPLNLVKFPAGNITKLCLVQTEIYILQLDDILQTVASTLEWLSIELNSDRLPSDLTEPPQHSSSPTHLPNLHTLELGEDGTHISTHILTNFWFPVLKTLYLDIQEAQIELFADLLESTTPITSDTTEMTKVHRVPFFNVRELIIRNMADLPTVRLRGLLVNAFPSLEWLYLADDFDDDQLVAIFSGANKGCKRLSSLRLLSSRGDLLKRFVDGRFDGRNGVTPLRRLELQSKEGITRKEWQYLQAKVDKVCLTDPEAKEEEYTDEGDDLDTNDPQQASGADADGESDWTTEEGTP